jgi:uncharacterized protein (TIGR00730 family)
MHEPAERGVPVSGPAHAIVDKALASLWQAANALSRLEPAEPPAYRVTIFGSARLEAQHPLYADVRHLARELAARGCDIVTGGGPGLMQAANEGAMEGDPDDRVRSIGLRVELPFEQGANPFVEDLYDHQTFFSRLHQFVRLSNAFVVVGGGIGTLLETALVWQLLQVGHATNVPLVLVGPMWRALVGWARAHMLASEPPLASPPDLDIPVCVEDAAEALAHLDPFLRAHADARAPRG